MTMRINAPDFFVFLHARNGVITQADRPIRYMVGWPLKRVVTLAAKWGWKIDASDEERAQLEQAQAGS